MQQDTDKAEAAAGTSAAVIESRPIRLMAMLVVGLVLTWGMGYWIRQAEIIALACQITEAVPPIPATTVLLLLLAINPLLRRLPLVRKLSTGEIVVVYLFVTVATTMFGCGIVRYLIACISAPYYYSTPATPLEILTPGIPAWLAPRDPMIHKWMYEASPTGAVPWGPWLVPIAAWAGFFLIFGGTVLCLMLLFADSWIDHERLVFPLVRLPLEIMGSQTGVSFFRNPMTWVGIGVAAVLNLINAVRGVFFNGPSGGLRFDLGNQLKDYPWQALRPITAHVRPGLIGLGYLVSTELSFSIWFFYLFQKFQALGLSMAGYRLGGMPFTQEQGIGAYLLLGLVLLWKGRGVIQQAWQELVGSKSRNERAHGWALVGVVVGIFGVLAFFVAAGMKPWLAGLYLGILLLVALAYGRLRAETGVPLLWAFPFGQQHKVIWNFLGQARVIGSGANLASPTMFALLAFMSRGYFLTVSAYDIEGIRLGQQSGVNWRQISTTVMFAIGLGAAAAFFFHLQPYYQEGGIGLRGGIWGANMAQQEYANVLHGTQVPVPPDTSRIIATCFGGLLIALIETARARWFNFPFHPTGYAVACSYGHLVWAPFLLVWIAKTLLLRYGGAKLYLRALPAFLGFALGHFITAGLIWGSLSAALGGPFLHWGVWFG